MASERTNQNLTKLKSALSIGASQRLRLPKYFSIQNCLGPISGVKPFAGVIVSIPPFSGLNLFRKLNEVLK